MKKELIAAVLLAVIFAGVMLNIRASERIVSSLMSEVDAAYAQLKGGDNESAVKTIDRAIERWLMLDGYTHIFIRHSEINSTTEAFFQFKSDIGSGDADAAEGSYGLLSETLRSTMTMEQISLGSIF